MNKQPQVSLTGAQGIVECFKLESIPKVFCVPGESYLPLMDAIRDEPSIDLISARHEGGASFMAEGFAKASGIPGIVMATRGVGGSNLTIGVHTAYQDSTPMVVLLGQVHSDFRGREGFQEIDLVQYFSPISKWAVEIQDPARIPELVQRAFRIAKTGRPGPVVLSLPEDLLKKKAKMSFGKPAVRPSPTPSSKEIHEIQKLLTTANRPIIIAGGGVKSSGGEEALIQFADKYQLPVMAAFRRHDIFPNNHPLYTGHLGLGMRASLLQTIQEADVILAIGTRLSEVTTQDYSLIRSNQCLVHIDIEYETLGKVYAPDIGIIADAREALLALIQMEITPSWTSWGREKRKAYEESVQTGRDNPTMNDHVISLLQEHLSPDAIITNDAGNFAGWLHTYYQFNETNTYIGPTSGAMGYGMPAALGVKLAHPDRTVVSLSGDGGFMMTMQELETAIRYNIPVISIIFNNSMYGTIRMHQEIHYPYKTIGTDLGYVPFARIAAEMGAHARYVEDEEEFKHALVEALQCLKPSVIEIKSDCEQISVSKTIEQIRKRN